MRPTAFLFAFACLLSACAHEDPAVVPVAPLPDGRQPRLESGEHGRPGAIASGKEIFRFDTFGDETFWTDTLRMHEVIRTSVSPKTALSVGLKVDADALPAAVKAGIANGTVALDSPSTTVTLLKLGAVVGVIGQVDAQNTLQRVGITCALCHSTVDNSFATGHRPAARRLAEPRSRTSAPSSRSRRR